MLLPTDVLIHIKSFVPPEYYLCCRLSCKDFASIFKEGAMMLRKTYMRKMSLFYYALEHFPTFFTDTLIEDTIPITNTMVLSEFALQFGLDTTNPKLCATAAKYGKIELLIWFHTCGCVWDEETVWNATLYGTISLFPIDDYLNIIKYATQNGCPYISNVCIIIATAINTNNKIASYLQTIANMDRVF